jgi:anti-anti-sigma factor
MKIRFWGTRGSIPSPLKPGDVESKIRQAIRTIWQMPGVDTTDLAAVLAAVEELPYMVRGTAGGNTPCVEVQAAGETLIIDAGSGLFQLGLDLMEGPCGRGQCTLHLLMSHCHWDHIQGFPMFMPAFVPGNRIFIYGVHDVERALKRQQDILTWPVSLSYMQAEKEFVKLQPEQAFSIGRVKINTLLNNHRNDAYSYRLEDQHSVLVYATDAEYKRLDEASLQPRVEFFSNADALVFDAQYTLKEVWQMRMDFGHSSAMIGVDLARAAGVRKLILFHHDPTYSDSMLQEIHDRALAYQSQHLKASAAESHCPTCEILLAYEGLTLDLAPPDAVALQFLEEDEAAILTPSSVFDERGVDQLAQRLTRISSLNAPTRSILDLSQVETLTTAGLKSLVALQQKRKSAPIVLVAPTSKVRQVIELGGYSDFFSVYESVEDALAAVQAREVLDLPGQMIKNRYQIQNKIGAGRLGIVLKAVDTVRPVTHPHRIVALKILYPSFSDNTIDRFMRQSEQIVNLDHPNIVEVFAWDRDERYAFKVETFVKGQTLHSFIRDPQSSEQEPDNPSGGGPDGAIRPQLHSSQIINIAFDVIRALEYAHSRGVIHGDLKPQNIFLTEEGTKVSGFGLGRLQEGRNLLDVPMLFLTAAYLSPEQILGQPLDARSDLYALGVILYQLFTGEPPFEGSNREVMQSHLRRAPRRPREINPQISVSLEHVILKLMAQNPNDRYASALQVRRILGSMLSYSGLVGGEDTTRPHWRPIVGREKQVRALRACWDDVLAGRGQLAFISGEPGVGKTSLAHHVAAQIRPPVLLTARCQEMEGGPAYQLFTELLQSYFATVPPEFLDLEAPAADETRQLLSNFTRLIPEIKQMLPDLPNPSPLGDAQQEQLRLMSSLTHFIKRATQERPWFLILDDLQWADHSSLQLLRDLAHHLPSMALMIIGIYSDVELEQGHPLMETLRDLRSHPTYRHFQLERLNPGEVNQLLTYIWQQPVPEALSDKIYQHTDGNPFYVEEVAKGLVDEGLVTADFHLEEDMPSAERQFPDLKELRLPQSVREAVWRHIGHLSSDTQMLLRQAAVLGQTFRLDDLQAISGLSEWEVLEHLDTALERQLIQEVPGNEARSSTALRFSHTEIQYVLYEDLGALRRRMLHRQAGEALERRVGSKTERVVTQLSHHFSKAGDFEKSFRYAFEAARLAHAAHDNDAALLWYRRALEMLDDLSLQQRVSKDEESARLRNLRLSVHESLGEVLDLVGRYDEALEHYATARDLIASGSRSGVDTALSVGQVHRMANLCRHTAEVYYNRSEYDLAFEWLEKGLNYISCNDVDEDDGQEAARIYLLGAWLYHRQSKSDAAAAWGQKALDIALKVDGRAGRQAVAHAYRLLGGIDARRGNFSDAVHMCRESVRLYQEIEDRVGLAKAYNNLAVAYYNQGDWAQAREAYNESLVIRQHVGDIYGQAIIIGNLAEIHRDRGAWDRAAELYEQSMAIWKQIGVRWGEALTLNDMAQLHIYKAELAEARDCLARSQAIFAEVGSHEYLPELERHWAEFYLESGELDHALVHIQRSIACAVEQHNPLEEGISRRVLGKVYLSRGEYELAKVGLCRSLEILGGLKSEYEIAKTKVSLARLSAKADDVSLLDLNESAQSYLSQATETFERLGAEIDLAEAHDFTNQLS